MLLIIGACLVTVNLDNKKAALKAIAEALDKENADYVVAVGSFPAVPKRVLQMHKENFANAINTYKGRLSYLIPKEPSAEVLEFVSKYGASIRGLVVRSLKKSNENGAGLTSEYESYKLFTSLVYDDLCKRSDELVENLQKITVFRRL